MYVLVLLLVTIVGILLIGIVFTLDHVWQHVAVAPPTTAKLRPLIVVMATATNESQVVDGGGATKTFTSWICQLLQTQRQTYTHTHNG